MGQNSIKASTPTSKNLDARSQFNFSGIKDLAKHPYISCLCSHNEPTYQSGPEISQHPLTPSQRNSLARSSNRRSKNLKLPSSELRQSNHYGGNQSPGLRKSIEIHSQVIHTKPNSYTPEDKTSDLFFNPSNRNSSKRGSKLTQNPAINPDTLKNAEILETIIEDKSHYNQDHIMNLSGLSEPKILDESQAGSQDLKEIVEDQMDSVIREEVFIGEGRRYRGDLLDGKPHGVGKEVWPDGSSYEGMYHFGTRTGEGVFVWPDKSMYRGNFIDNEMQGYGIFEWGNGNKYEGMWNKSKMHGEGKYTWNNGNQYVGNYFEGLKHGEGNFIYHDGRIVSGKWLNGHIQVV